MAHKLLLLDGLDPNLLRSNENTLERTYSQLSNIGSSHQLLTLPL